MVINFLKNRGNGGYIAITSVIILSLLLVLVSAGIAQSAYMLRLSVLESQFKLQSKALAESCVYMALLRLNQHSYFTGPETVYITQTDFCQILGVNSQGAYKLIRASAGYMEAYTQIDAIVDPQNSYSLISWIEK